MVYKYDKENNNWIIGNEARFPDGYIINETNKTQKDGFEWFDEIPIEYIEWLQLKEEEQDEV